MVKGKKRLAKLVTLVVLIVSAYMLLQESVAAAADYLHTEVLYLWAFLFAMAFGMMWLVWGVGPEEAIEDVLGSSL